MQTTLFTSRTAWSRLLLPTTLGILFFFGAFAPAFAQNPLEVAENANKFERLLKLVDSRYVDTVATTDLVETAIKQMLKDLDPHSVYISKEDLQRANEPLQGNFEGVGIQFNILNDTILVVAAISGGPSEKLGIRSGDKIVEIEGEAVAGIGITNQDVIDQLRGKKGTKVAVGIKRAGVNDLLDFTIERDKIPIYSVDATYMAAPDVGYIKINRFAAITMEEFSKGIKELEAEGMKHLILDLRGNGGGYLKTAIDLADEFLGSRKLIVYTEGRSYPKDEKFATSNGDFEKGKLVVLIDEGSASASEIVSGAIQDHDRGLIIGRRSFGKGLVQKPFSLPDGSAVRLTVSRYYTPAGRCIQKPYDDGVKAYRQEINKRLTGGELMSMDSIDLPDSLRFKTLGLRRDVYGGGGIMPDIFVPLDTSMNSEYYTSVLRKGALNQFVLDHLDNHRADLEAQYPDKDKFIKEFSISKDMMDDFIVYAEEKGAELDAAGLETSKKLIETQLKALLGRNLFTTSVYYEVTNELNDAYQTALEVLADDTFQNMKLKYK